ncbi:sugar-binding transcriptional regulator [Oceanobacillus neutriphilus]|uniref:DeoR family transcriptional regulator n=1 Tax=Oceanobacillus neutriphilus TaxID=531815 RepID=A0ABQ2NQI2_9BACI|nr:sugar-binding transcriptional regulator [Oceanobacillus neutriphilus]GGP09283.1 DeoR family transcriptional regulator [Oceanobacillus neutriphilus]
MLSWEERRSLVKIANLYYNDGWTQEQIAKKLGVSRPVISKSLQKAREHKIIEIFIKDETVHTVNLEKKLEEHFGLEDAVVVPISGQTPDVVKLSVAQAGAYYLSKNIKKAKKMGISWGTTLEALVQEYPYEMKKNITIFPLEGGLGRKKVEIHSNQLAYELAKRLGGTCSYLYAPAMAESSELRERLMKMDDINAVLQEAATVDIALVGLSNPYVQSTLEDIGYLNQNDLEQLRQLGVVGDMGFRFFDLNGNPVNSSFNKKVIGISLEQLRNIKKVIGVVSGAHKAESVLAALKGNYINVLVLDEQIATELLYASE